MCSTWEALRASLVHSVSTLKADTQFKRAASDHSHLSRFGGADALVAYLSSKGGNLDEKDRIYRVLIQAVQSRSEWAELAKALLWLGLWPGLDAIYWRRRATFHEKPEAVASDIAVQFEAAVSKCRLSRVNRVAATLVRNTEREIREDGQRPSVSAAQRAKLSEYATNIRADCQERMRAQLEMGLPLYVDVDQAVEGIRNLFADQIGKDADLMVGVLFCGETQRESGERIGLTHSAARQRVRRATGRLRKIFADPQKNCVPFRPANPRFFFVNVGRDKCAHAKPEGVES